MPIKAQQEGVVLPGPVYFWSAEAAEKPFAPRQALYRFRARLANGFLGLRMVSRSGTPGRPKSSRKRFVR
jgi:hypothetical protein